MRLDAVADLLARQDGVVSRRQLLDAKLTQAQIDTLLRRRDLVVVHPGVYLTHTGTPTWSQRSWAAILYAGRSALHLGLGVAPPGQGPAPSGPIHVAVDWTRRVAPQRRRPPPPGARARGPGPVEPLAASRPARGGRGGGGAPGAGRPRGDLGPGRGRRRAAHGGRACEREIERRGRLRRRALLTDAARRPRAGHAQRAGARLPRPRAPAARPARAHVAAGGGERRRRHAVPRCAHADLDLPVELDGQLHDGSDARDDDADRDLDDLARGLVTPRLRYRQVFATPCRTASRLAVLFAARGWEGTPRSCGASRMRERGSSS